MRFPGSVDQGQLASNRERLVQEQMPQPLSRVTTVDEIPLGNDPPYYSSTRTCVSFAEGTKGAHTSLSSTPTCLVQSSKSSSVSGNHALSLERFVVSAGAAVISYTRKIGQALDVLAKSPEIVFKPTSVRPVSVKASAAVPT